MSYSPRMCCSSWSPPVQAKLGYAIYRVAITVSGLRVSTRFLEPGYRDLLPFRGLVKPNTDTERQDLLPVHPKDVR